MSGVVAVTRTREAERVALEDLLSSEGWAIVKELVEETHGAAQQIAAIDAAMRELRPGDDERAVVTQIRAAALAVHNVIAVIEKRAAALTQAAEQKSKLPFAAFRRGPRR